MTGYKLGERPEYSEVALNWEKYADYLEKQRDELAAALQEIVTRDESHDGRHQYAAIARAALARCGLFRTI